MRAFVFCRNLIGCSRVGYELCVAVLRVEIDFYVDLVKLKHKHRAIY